MATSPRSSDPRQATALQAVDVLGRLAAVFAERRRQLAESVGLTDQQWQALEEIQTEHFMPSLFARERKSSAAAVSKILRQLLDKGLITTHVSDGDARKREYVVTVRGQTVMSTLRAERQRAIEQVWLAFPQTELARFAELGSELAQRLESFARENRPSARSTAAPDAALPTSSAPDQAQVPSAV